MNTIQETGFEVAEWREYHQAYFCHALGLWSNDGWLWRTTHSGEVSKPLLPIRLDGGSNDCKTFDGEKVC